MFSSDVVLRGVEQIGSWLPKSLGSPHLATLRMVVCIWAFGLP